MPFIHLEKHRIYYQKAGAGPPVVLLHNATGSTRDWRHIMPRLAQAGYQAIAYDRPGFGRSTPLAHWPLDYLHHDREQVIALIDALELERVALVGNSDGATISLLAAAAYPARVAAVVAESPHLWYEKDSLATGFQYFKQTLKQNPRVRRFLRYCHGAQAEQVIARWRSRWLDPAFFEWDDRSVLEQISCPALVIHGQNDPFFPVSHSQTIVNSLTDAQFILLEDVGHTPHAEIVNDYTNTVLSFLSSVYPITTNA
ncbi:MAG: hypothetical protein DSY55_05810 [Clostridia bacterium]|nr:MAG: hypothetical protein DSY55_05810 [Clostridia bacterium]